MKIVPVTGNFRRRGCRRLLLAAPRLMRLGVTEPDGTPLVHPLWYTWEQDQFLLHIGITSSKRTAIDMQPTVYFTVDDTGPGIFGVRGKAGCNRPDQAACVRSCRPSAIGTPG